MGHQSSVCGNVEVFFSHVEVCFPHEGVFSHVQGEVFLFLFLPPWTHVVPLEEEFLRGFVPQNPVPSCLCLLPVPLPGDPGSDVFTYSDPWPPDNTGWYLGSSKEITGPLDPTPHPPLKSMFLPPRHKSGEARSPWRRLPSIDNRFPARGKGDLCIPALSGNLPSHGPGHISLNGNMFLHVDVCFPGRGSRSPQLFPAFPNTSGPAHNPPYIAGGERLQVDRATGEGEYEPGGRRRGGRRMWGHGTCHTRGHACLTS